MRHSKHRNTSLHHAAHPLQCHVARVLSSAALRGGRVQNKAAVTRGGGAAVLLGVALLSVGSRRAPPRSPPLSPPPRSSLAVSECCAAVLPWPDSEARTWRCGAACVGAGAPAPHSLRGPKARALGPRAPVCSSACLPACAAACQCAVPVLSPRLTLRSRPPAPWWSTRSSSESCITRALPPYAFAVAAQC